MLIDLIGLVLKLGPALLVLAALTLMFARAPRASLSVVLFATVLTESREWPFPSAAEIGTFNVSVFDVFMVLFGSVALWRSGWQWPARPGRGALLTIAALTSLGLLIWARLEGLQVSVNFWRQWMFPLAACWYAASWPSLRTRAGLQPIVWAALLGSLTQALGIALRGFGSNRDAVLVDGALVGARPITASVALLILFGAVLLVIDRTPASPPRLLAAAWLGASVLVAQHRSVWVAGVVAAILVAHSIARGAQQRLVAGTLGAIGLVFAGALVSRIVQFQSDLSVAASDTSTFQWRIENWAEKLSVPRAPGEWLFGSAFGPTPVTERFESTLEFQVSAHSMLIDVVSSLGLVGVVAVAVIVVVAARAPQKLDMAVWILTVSLVVYGSFYSWPMWAWLLLGVLAQRPRALHDRPGQLEKAIHAPDDSASPVKVRRRPTASVRRGLPSGAVR